MRRMECLDGLRGLLAAYVMLAHLAPFAALPAWAAGALSHGQAAVDVFFALSGLVILQSLAAHGDRARPFLAARARRIFPVFLVVFALALAVAPIAPGWERMPWIDHRQTDIWPSGWPEDALARIAAHLTMTHGLFPDAVLPDVWIGLLGAAWSLSTEWQFYLLALLVAPRLGAGDKRARRFAAALLGLAALGQGWQAVAPPGWQFSRAFLPLAAQYFALGVASIGVARGRPGAWRLHAAVLAATLALCVPGGAAKLLPPLVWTLCLAAECDRARPRQPGSFAAFLGTALCAGTARVLRGATLQWLGALSYCLYLVNEPVQKLAGVAIARLADGDRGFFTLLFAPAAIAGPLAAAALLHRHVEQPWLRRRPRAASDLARDEPLQPVDRVVA